MLSPLRFIELLDVAAHEASIRDWFAYKHTSLSSHAISVARYMVTYKSYLEGQRYLNANALDVKIVAHALSKFTHLEEMNLNFWDNHMGSRELIEAFEVFECPRLLIMNCEYALALLFQALAFSASIKTFRLAGDTPLLYDKDCPNLESAALMGNSSLSTQATWAFGPGELRTGPINLKTITPQAFNQVFSRPDYHGCRYSLREVRELEIGQINIPDSDHLTLTGIIFGLRSLVSFTPRLEKIILGEINGPKGLVK